MFKALLRTLPSLTGNFSLCCNINDVSKIDTDHFVCFVKTANALPLQNNLYFKNINVDLLNGDYCNDVARFYDEYKDYFYSDNFKYIKNDYNIFDIHKDVSNRNISYEFGCSRQNINNYQFKFFAPIYIDNKNDLPEYFKIVIRLGDTVKKEIKVHISTNSDKNILGHYLRKYLDKIDSRMIFLSNIDNYGIYYGIDVKNGSLSEYKNIKIGKIFTNYMSMYDFDNVINKGFEDMNMICRQIIPLMFSFNVEDVLTEQEKLFFKFSKVSISGYWQKHNVSEKFYDFENNYTSVTNNIKLKDNIIESLYSYSLSDEQFSESSFYNFHETKNILYKYTNKITKNFNKWKLNTTTDKNPYVINSSFLFSNLGGVVNYYNFPMQNNASSDIVNNSLCIPFNKQGINMCSTSITDNWLKSYINNSSQWFNVIDNNTEINSLCNIEKYWSDVINNEVMFNSILYNNIDANKFGVFVKCNIRIIDQNKSIYRCKFLYDRENNEDSEYTCSIYNYVNLYKYDKYRYDLFLNDIKDVINAEYGSKFNTNQTPNTGRISVKNISDVFNYIGDDTFINNGKNNFNISHDMLLEKDNSCGNIVEFNPIHNRWTKISKDKSEFEKHIQYISNYISDIQYPIDTFELITNDDIKNCICAILYIFNRKQMNKVKEEQYNINVSLFVNNTEYIYDDIYDMAINNNDKNNKLKYIIEWINKNIYVSHKSTSQKINIKSISLDSILLHTSEYNFYVLASFMPTFYFQMTDVFKQSSYTNVNINKELYYEPNKEYEYVNLFNDITDLKASYFNRIESPKDIYMIFCNLSLFLQFVNNISFGLYKIQDINDVTLIKELQIRYNSFMNNLENQKIYSGYDRLYDKINEFETSNNLEMFKEYKMHIGAININSETNDIKYSYELEKITDNINDDIKNTYVIVPIIKLTDGVKTKINNIINSIKTDNERFESFIDEDKEYLLEHNLYICTENNENISLIQENKKAINNLYVIDLIDSTNIFNTQEAFDFQTKYIEENVYLNSNTYQTNTFNHSYDYCIQLSDEENEIFRKEIIRNSIQFILDWKFYNSTQFYNLYSQYGERIKVGGTESRYIQPRYNGNKLDFMKIDLKAGAQFSKNIVSYRDIFNFIVELFITNKKLNVSYKKDSNDNSLPTYHNIDLSNNGTAIITMEDVTNIVGEHDVSEIFDIDSIYDTFTDIIYNNMIVDNEYANTIVRIINECIDIFNDIYSSHTNVHKMNHIEFFNSYNTNSIKYNEEEIEFNGKKYLAYVIGLNIDASKNSFNINKSNNINYTFDKINNHKITEEYIIKNFKYICPLLQTNLFVQFLNHYKKNICIPKRLAIVPNMITNKYIITLSDISTKYINSMNYSGQLYKTEYINSVVHSIFINRYFSYITPIFKEINGGINDFYLLKFKEKNVGYINEDNMYSISNYNIQTNIPIRHYTSENNFYEIEQIEEKSFNYSKYYLIPNYIEIKIDKNLTYSELLEYEKEDVVKQYFIDYIDKNSFIHIDDSNIKLFLYNKYNLQFVSEVIKQNLVTNEKIYSLKYQFTITND